MLISCKVQDADDCVLYEDNPFVIIRNTDCLKSNGYREGHEVGYYDAPAYAKIGVDSVMYVFQYTTDSASLEREIFTFWVFKEFHTVNYKTCRKFIEQKGGYIYDFKESVFDVESGLIYQRFKVRGKKGDIFECELVPHGENIYQFSAHYSLQ
jgi:hypothetical protein